MGQSTKEADEALACLVLRTVLRAAVELVDKAPLQGHHDLEIRYPHGRIDAGEVVSARDPQWQRLIHSIPRRSYTECADLTRLWFVLVKPTASLKDLDIPSLLRELEDEGLDQVSDLGHASMEMMLRSLRIEFCSSTRPTPDHPPGFFLVPKILTAMIGDGDNAVQFVGGFMAGALCSSKAAKLRRAEAASERHLVIILTPEQLGPHTAIHTGEMPTQPPDLPQGVDRLWVIAAEWSAATRVIYWSPAGQWSETVVTLNT